MMQKKTLSAKKKKTTLDSLSVADRDLPVLFTMLHGLPGVEIKKHFGHTSFLAGEKVFAFTRKEGVALKLSQEKIKSLARNKNVAPLVMGKKIMKEWIVLTHKNPEELANDLELFQESVRWSIMGQKDPLRGS